MRTYSKIQELFLMNISSNAGSSQTGSDIEHKVFKKIASYLKDNELTNWEIAWGPGVYRKEPTSTPDNVIFLAFNKTTSTYFLSVAGTNPYSIVDWIEDLDTQTTQQWAWTDDSNVQIASGTSSALDILSKLTGKACTNGVPAGDDITLQAYLTSTLQKAASVSCSMNTGGHSLGGALAPALALWLADTQSNWDPNNTIGHFSSSPSAGPTIGTAGFKSYYNSRIPDTTRIHNSLDVVPHAWNTTDLEAVKTLYAPAIGNSDCVNWLVDRCLKKVSGIDYQQAGLNDMQLTGEINKDIINQYYPNGINIGLQLNYQHVDAYYHLLDLAGNASAYTEPTTAELVAYFSGVAAAHKTI